MIHITVIVSGIAAGPYFKSGMTALRAVFYPDMSRYLYFRLIDANAGKHHFSDPSRSISMQGTLFIKKVNG